MPQGIQAQPVRLPGGGVAQSIGRQAVAVSCTVRHRSTAANRSSISHSEPKSNAAHKLFK